MGKQRHEEDSKRENEKKKGDKKTDKKGSKEKKRPDNADKQMSSQNGALPINGKNQQKKDNSRKQINHKKENKKTGGGWSCFGIFNVLLLVLVLIAGGVCAALYTEGDLSVGGLQRAWPRFKRNSATFLNMTKEAIHFEKVKVAANNVVNVVGPLLLKVTEVLVVCLSAAKKLLFQGILALSPLTGDLSPYLESLESFCGSVSTQIVWFYGLVIDWISSLDWGTVFGGVRWMVEFIVEQSLVLKEEFWKNEAISSMWKDMKPIRETIWTNTESLRWCFEYLWTEFCDSLLPFIRKETYNMYLYGKDTLQSVIS